MRIRKAALDERLSPLRSAFGKGHLISTQTPPRFASARHYRSASLGLSRGLHRGLWDQSLTHTSKPMTTQAIRCRGRLGCACRVTAIIYSRRRMYVGSTREDASHVIVELDLVTGNRIPGNRIPGDRHDDSDKSGSTQRRNSTEVLESRRPELGSSACTNRTQKPAYCRVQRFRSPKLIGQVIWRAYLTIPFFSRARSLRLPRSIVCFWLPTLNHYCHARLIGLIHFGCNTSARDMGCSHKQ